MALPKEIGLFIPEYLQEKYKRYVLNNSNTAEAYDVAFNALCAVREMIAKECEPAEIDEFISEKQGEMWKICMKNKVPLIPTAQRKGKNRIVG